VVVVTDYSDQDFLVFTQSGPQSDIPESLANGNYAATPDIPVLQYVLTL